MLIPALQKAVQLYICLSAQSCLAFCDLIDCSPPDSSVHGIFPGRTTGVGCHFLLQRMFLTQGLNLHLLHWQADSLPLSHLQSPHFIYNGLHLLTPIHLSPKVFESLIFSRAAPVAPFSLSLKFLEVNFFYQKHTDSMLAGTKGYTSIRQNLTSSLHRDTPPRRFKWGVE